VEAKAGLMALVVVHCGLLLVTPHVLSQHPCASDDGQTALSSSTRTAKGGTKLSGGLMAATR
jgi:hypothetical protein